VLIAAVLGVAWIYLRRRGSPVLGAAAAVTAFVAFNKVFSPQYVEWLAPLVPGAGYVAAALVVVILVLTRIIFQHFTTGQPTTELWIRSLAWWVMARDLVVLGLLGLLIAQLRRVRSSAAARWRTSR
jgi:hypothetical protein